MAKHRPMQAGLFDRDDPAAPQDAAAAALIAIPGAVESLSKARQAFNRLSEQIGRQRALLAAWEAATERCARRVAAELEPLKAHMRDAQRRLVRRLDALLDAAARARDKHERLSRRQRSDTASALCELVQNLLEDGPDAEMQALHDKHNELSLDEMRQVELEMAQALMGGILGRDALDGIEADSAEELMRQAALRMQQRMQSDAQACEANREQRSTRRGGQPTRAQQAAEAKAQAALEASRSVREVFRKLASAIHPDRASDPLERERRTSLMQRANQAYERNDLLTLLSLQIEIEQIDPDHLTGVPERRIEHFNQVLKEQLRSLEREVADCVAELMPPSGRGKPPQPHHLDRVIDAELAGLRQVTARLESDLAGLDDPARRRVVLDHLHGDDDIDDLGGEAGLGLALLAAMAHGAPNAARKRRHAPTKKGKARRK